VSIVANGAINRRCSCNNQMNVENLKLKWLMAHVSPYICICMGSISQMGYWVLRPLRYCLSIQEIDKGRWRLAHCPNADYEPTGWLDPEGRKATTAVFFEDKP